MVLRGSLTATPDYSPKCRGLQAGSLFASCKQLAFDGL